MGKGVPIVNRAKDAPVGKVDAGKRFTGSAWSIVRKDGLYVPVRIELAGNEIVSVEIGNADTFAMAENRVAIAMRNWTRK